jgi:hypothetical protein
MNDHVGVEDLTYINFNFSTGTGFCFNINIELVPFIAGFSFKGMNF